jgi:hypothetical protein
VFPDRDDFRSIADDGVHARARSPPLPYWRVRSRWAVVTAPRVAAAVAVAVSEVGERPGAGLGWIAESEHLPKLH